MNADWFYSLSNDKREGPVTEDDLKRLVEQGRLKPTDLVWKDGMADWVEARTVSVLFPPPKVEPLPDEERPVRRRFDDDGRPSRRGRDDDDRQSRRGRDDDHDRPSRRGRRNDDELDPDDDRPKVRRRDDRDDDRDDYDDRPRRRSKQKPGQAQGVGIMMLIGGILGLLFSLGLPLFSGGGCCLWPGTYYELVIGILLLIRGINMLNQDDQGPPRTLAILQIICIVNADVINCVLGIVSLVMLNDPKVQDYYRRRGFV